MKASPAFERRRLARSAAIAGLGAYLAAAAVAADYPSRVVRIIIPFAAGGAVDIVGRSFSQKLSEAIQQAVVIENRPGADAVIGVKHAVGANPDGYTILLTTGSMIAAPLFIANVPFDPLRDLIP